MSERQDCYGELQEVRQRKDGTAMTNMSEYYRILEKVEEKRKYFGR